MLIRPFTQPASCVPLEDFLYTPVPCVGWPFLWGFTESGHINLNPEEQQITQLYCLMKRHHTLYRQLGAISWHANSTRSSPPQHSTSVGIWTPQPSRNISDLLIHGQSFQKVKTPMPLSVSAANGQNLLWCRNPELLKSFEFRTSSPPTVACCMAVILQLLYWL